MIKHRFKPGARVEITENEWLEVATEDREGPEALMELRSDTDARDGIHFTLEDIRLIQQADLIESYEAPDPPPPREPGEAIYLKTMSLLGETRFAKWKDLHFAKRDQYAKAERELKAELDQASAELQEE